MDLKILVCRDWGLSLIQAITELMSKFLDFERNDSERKMRQVADMVTQCTSYSFFFFIIEASAPCYHASQNTR